MTLRLILVDDQEMYRLGFRMLLETQEGVEVVGEAEDGRAAVDLIERVEADIVLMDVRMPRMNGIDATRTVVQGAADGPRVIVLTTFDLDEYAYEAIRAGASGFLLKDASLEELMAAIHHVHAGDAVMAPSTTRRLIEHFTLPPPVIDDGDDRFRALEDLTAREREVLALVCEGLPNAEIGERLHLAESTVKTHVKALLAKTGRRNRVELIVHAFRHGLVDYRR